VPRPRLPFGPLARAAAALALGGPARAEPVAHELGVGLLGAAVAPAPLTGVDRAGASPGGEVTWRHENLWAELAPGSAYDQTMGDARVRITGDPDGVMRLDRLELDMVPLSLRVRPQLGDRFDLSLLGGSIDEIWLQRELPRGFWRMYSPTTITLLGLSDTDQDDDDKVKAYVQAGLGLGAEVLTGGIGPLGLHLRADGEARSLNRHRGGALKNHVRHEIVGQIEGGLAWTGPAVGLRLDAWTELITQWETRDADGKSGADRQAWAAGLRLVLRHARTLPPRPGEAIPLEAQELDGAADLGLPLPEMPNQGQP
jgi:hypothetical protein